MPGGPGRGGCGCSDPGLLASRSLCLPLLPSCPLFPFCPPHPHQKPGCWGRGLGHRLCCVFVVVRYLLHEHCPGHARPGSGVSDPWCCVAVFTSQFRGSRRHPEQRPWPGLWGSDRRSPGPAAAPPASSPLSWASSRAPCLPASCRGVNGVPFFEHWACAGGRAQWSSRVPGGALVEGKQSIPGHQLSRCKGPVREACYGGPGGHIANRGCVFWCVCYI